MLNLAKRAYRRIFRKKTHEKTEEEIAEIVNNYAKNDILVMVPDLPSNEYPNINKRAFNRIKEYIKNGLKIDVIVCNDYFTTDAYTYSYDDVEILRTGYNQVRNLLIGKHYKKILIHKPVLTYYKILNAVNIKDTQVLLYPYCNDFTKDIQGVTDRYKVEETGDIDRYDKRANFKIVFASTAEKEIFEKVNNKELKNSVVVQNAKEDVKLIKSFKDVEKIEIPTISKKPLLSISIASYNVQDFIIQILCSLLRSKYADKLEILVVNDGSSDDTVKTVDEFIKENYHGKGNPVVRLIDKPNGGHGSTINKGLELATGKYFRLLDGDDYYVTEQLDVLLEYLENEDTDLIFTEYYEDYAITGEFIKTKQYNDLIPGHQYKFEEICTPGAELVDWGPLLHTSTYKTKLLQDLKFKIDENCFYVDNEFNLMGVFAANTVKLYPLYVYSYYLGRPGQSVSPESYKKKVKQLQKVIFRIIEEYEAKKDELSEEKCNYIENHMVINLCYTMYWIVTELYSNAKPFQEFDDELKKHPDFYNGSFVRKRLKIFRKTHGHFLFLTKIIK